MIKNAAKEKIALPVFALSMLKVVSETTSRTYGSIFAILGLAEKLISGGLESGDAARVVFNRAYPMLTVSAPSWSNRDSTEVDVDEGYNDDSQNMQYSQDLLWENVETWLDDVKNLSEITLPSGVF